MEKNKKDVDQKDKRTHNIGEVEVIHETVKALLIANGEVDDQGRAAGYWIPKSQIDITSDVQAMGDQGDLVVSEWIAIQNGFEIESTGG